MVKLKAGGLLKLSKLWAPWRMDYIIRDKSKECVFCQIQKSTNDKKNLVIYRSDHCYIVLNKFPYNNGHLLVVTNRHVDDIEKLKDKEFIDFMKVAKDVAVPLLRCAINAEGFNIGINMGKAAGAGIAAHLHMHIVPRWQGDTNFMPVIADTKVISQSLKNLYTKLDKCLRKKK